jgi:LDH2 family malate/lactate/ureidoglycolate dehydrogenase
MRPRLVIEDLSMRLSTNLVKAEVWLVPSVWRSSSLTGGSGIYGPGYEERRKQRIKERYGIEIQEPYYKNKPAEGMAKF